MASNLLKNWGFVTVITHFAKPFIPTSNGTSKYPLPTASPDHGSIFQQLTTITTDLLAEVRHGLSPSSAYDTVDGRNPAPVEVGRLSLYLQDFMHRRWCRISSISNWNHFGPSKKKGIKFLGFACLMLGKSRNIFSHMVIYHGKK